MKIENKKKLLWQPLLMLLSGVIIGSFLHFLWHSYTPNENTWQKNQQSIAKSADKTTSTPATADELAKKELYLRKFKQYLSEKDYQNSLILYQEADRDSTDSALKLQNYLFEYLENIPQDVKITILELYLEHFPNDVTFIVKLAEIYKKNKNFYQALKLYLQSDVRNEAWLNWSDKQIYQLAQTIYNTDTNTDELFDLFIYLVQRYPSYSFYRFALAKLYLMLGYTEEAKSELLVLTDSDVYGNKAKELLSSIVQPNEDSNLETSSIPLSKYGNHFVITTHSSGIKMKLLIDTGTTFTVLTSKILAQIQEKHGLIKVGKVNLVTANGEIVSNLYRLKSFILGNYEITNLDVAESETDLDGLDGLLGMNALSDYNLFIDQTDNLLSIIPKQ